MVMQGDFLLSYHEPVLSAEQNDSQSEEINVIDESQAKNKPVPVQEAELRFKRVYLVSHFVCCAWRPLKRSLIQPTHCPSQVSCM